MKSKLVLLLAMYSTCEGFATDDEEIQPSYVRQPYGGFPGVEKDFLKIIQLDLNKIVNAFISHMKIRNIQRSMVFSCGSLLDNKILLRNLMASGFTATVLNLNEIMTEEALRSLLPQRENLAILIDMGCGGKSTRIIEMASSGVGLFNEGFAWLLVGSKLDKVVRVMSIANLDVNTDVVVLTAIEAHSEIWITFDLYNHGFKYGGKFNMTFHGVHSISNLQKDAENWRSDTPFPEALILNQNDDITKEMLSKKIEHIIADCKCYLREFQNRVNVLKGEDMTLNFGGMKVRYAYGWWIFLTDSWVQRRLRVENITLKNGHISVGKFKGMTLEQYASTPINTNVEVLHRYNYVLYTHLMQLIGFRLDHVRLTEWGVMKNNSWSGLVGAVHAGLVDVTTSPVANRPDRVGFGENAAVTYKACVALIFLQPEGDEITLKAFARPLDAPVWWTVLAITALSAALYVIAVRIENYLIGVTTDSVEGSWSYAMLTIVCVFYQQGPERSPRMWSGRALTVSLLLFGSMFYQFYSASLVGALLAAPPRRVRSPRDLIDGAFAVGAEDQTYERTFFADRRYPYAAELYDRKIGPPGHKPAFMSAEEGLRRVRKGGFAFQVDTATAYRIMQEWEDETICRTDEFYVYPVVHIPTWVRHFMPLKQHILTGYRRMQERGVSARELRTWSTARPRCPPEFTAKLQAVGVQLAPAGVALAAAGLLSLLILVAELWIHKISHKIQNHRNEMTHQQVESERSIRLDFTH